MAVLIIILVFTIAALIVLAGWLVAQENRERRERQRPKPSSRPAPTTSRKPAQGQSADARHERSRQWWAQAAAAQRKQRQGHELANARDELLVEYEPQRGLNQRLAGAALLSVLDGDTISVISKSGAATRVRLYAIDAPELAQSGGYAARDFLQRLLQTSGGFALGTHYTDHYGRSVATLYPNNASTAPSYNWAMAANGHAHWLPDFSGAELELNDAQHCAPSERLGIWQKPAAELPSSFRRRKQKQRPVVCQVCLSHRI